MCVLDLQSRGIRLHSSGFRMEATCFSETLVNVYQTTRCHLAEYILFRNYLNVKELTKYKGLMWVCMSLFLNCFVVENFIVICVSIN